MWQYLSKNKANTNTENPTRGKSNRFDNNNTFPSYHLWGVLACQFYTSCTSSKLTKQLQIVTNDQLLNCDGIIYWGLWVIFSPYQEKFCWREVTKFWLGDENFIWRTIFSEETVPQRNFPWWGILFTQSKTAQIIFTNKDIMVRLIKNSTFFLNHVLVWMLHSRQHHVIKYW